MAEFRCESIEKYGDCAVDREQWRGEERPIQCSFCCYYKPIMTNAEKIRAMTDEELAKWISEDYYVPHCPTGDGCPDDLGDHDGCDVCWMKWLKQEAK